MEITFEKLVSPNTALIPCFCKQRDSLLQNCVNKSTAFLL